MPAVRPLLSTAALLRPEAEVAAADGVYDAPVEVGDRLSYTGEVKGHRLCGSGTLVCGAGRFTGSFERNVLHGRGTFTAASSAPASAASSSTGTPVVQGRGSESSGTEAEAATTVTSPPLPALLGGTAPPIRSYIGEWADGVPQGAGVMEWCNGDRYEGGFDQGHPHGGSGTFTYADGRVYTGEFARGERDGKGRLTLPNGDVYDGQFVRNTITGFGTATYAGGARVFRGLFDHGRKVRGALEFPGTPRGFNGEWQDEKPHGTGHMTFANGDFYEGDFAAGELQGIGCLFYAAPAGRVYYGQFFHGQPYGKGFLYESKAPADNSEETGAAAAASTDATVVAGYFLNGHALAADDAANVEAVRAATRGMRGPEEAAPPYATLLAKRSAATGGSAGNEATHGSPSSQARSGAVPAMGPLLLGPSSAADPTSTPYSFGGVPYPLSASDRPLVPVTADSDSSAEDTPTTGEGVEEEEDGEASPETPPMSMPPLAAAESGEDGGCRGWLDKCSIGRHKLRLMSNWKKRYFILARCNDSTCLGYYEDELCQHPVGLIRLDPMDTRVITCPTTKTHRKATRPGRDFCVIYHEGRKEFKLLLRAPSAEDHDRWALALRTFFQIVDRPSDHPMGLTQGSGASS